MSRLLVVAAHPDDEILGCGATVARRVGEGWEAHLLVLATGATSRYGDDADQQQRAAAEVATLRDQLAQAAAIVGFASTRTLDFPDNRLDAVPRAELTAAVDEAIERLRPDVVLTHHAADYNWDHGRVFDAVLMAARPSPGEFAPRELWAFEVPSSTERAWQTGERGFHPNVYVEVAATIGHKQRALACYRGEVRPYPHPRSAEGVEYLARKRGLEIGVTHAEAFELIRRIDGG